MNFSFNPEKYGKLLVPLLAVSQQMTLARGEPNPEAAAALKSLKPETMFGNQVIHHKDMASQCLSGLWLLHGYLDQSHEISQASHSAEGSYWHGLMHRREPDFPNSKYWFSRVANHPVVNELSERVPKMVKQADLDFSTAFLAQQERWDAAKFVDLCQAVLMGRSEANRICLRIATLEWELLFDYCYRGAIGKL